MFVRQLGAAIVLAGAMTLPAGAQETVTTETKPAKPAPTLTLDELVDETGEIVIKDYYELGRVNGIGRVTVQALVAFRAVDETQRARGMQFEITDGAKNDLIGFSIVDQQEIEYLSKVLEYLVQLSLKWKNTERPEYSEVQFTTKRGMKVGFYQRRRDQGAFVSAGDPGAARAFVETEELEKLRTLVLRGLSLLNAK